MKTAAVKVWEVFWRFLLLGCISFGGPAAHIGYFQRQFVERLRWLDADGFGRLIALSQFLPGPGSSQLGFALGLQRAGLAGACAAFIGFTLPSFFLLYGLSVSPITDSTATAGIVHGLKLLAVVVVADAVLTMYKNFCTQQAAAAIAVLTATTLLLIPGLASQLLVLAGAALFGSFYSARNAAPKMASSLGDKQVYRPARAPTGPNAGIKRWPLGLFLALLFGLPALAQLVPEPLSTTSQLLADFYQAGSLVFGGGHVVLPLLQQSLGSTLDSDQFLLGYAAAQAVPGPMFSLAAFLGGQLMADSPLLGALLATLAIFLPGFLLLLSVHDGWQRLAARPRVAAAVWGLNASVVGLLMAALYQPIFLSAVTGAVEMALVIAGFFALRVGKIPVVALVGGFATIGLLTL